MFFLLFTRRRPVIGIAIGAAMTILGLVTGLSILAISGVVVLGVSGYRSWAVWQRHGVRGLVRTKDDAAPLR